MNKAMVSCDDCGGMFASPYHLQNHVRNGCDEGPARKKRKVASWEEEDVHDNVTFKQFRNEALAENVKLNAKLWEEKVRKYEKQGMDKKVATRKVVDKMIDLDKQAFFSKYSHFLKLTAQLRDSSVHDKILENINERLDNGEGVGTAIKRAIQAEKQDFDPLFGPDSIEKSDDESDESDSDENAEDDSDADADDSENEADDSDTDADSNSDNEAVASDTE
jgi:ribosomal protein L17